MRILKIKGANLASLAGEFEIDLTAEPLKSAGLFAITGETGAGKSTLLDAMCLALYGECPRLSSAGVNDDVPDVAGETIKSRDARAILRRGATTGYAEVSFQAADGENYCASWTVRRARGKSDGRLQNVERSLVQLVDGQVLESQSMRVKERVEALSGLTYDEFRRTVLLAQGDFDAFLRASTQERAGLLEKVTGTEIYRQISQRVYERFGVLRDALAQLEQRRAETSALTQDARAELAEEKTALVAELRAISTALKGAGDKLQAHENLQSARARVVLASEAEVLARAAVVAAASDREQLAQLRKALDLRVESARDSAALEALEQLQVQQTQTHTRQVEASALAAQTRVAQALADQAVIAAEKSFKDFGPTWTEATRLDGLQKTALEEFEKAKTALADMQSRQAVAEAASRELMAEETRATQTRDAAVARLSHQPELRILAENWPRTAELMDQRLVEVETIRTTEKAMKAAQAQAGLLVEEAIAMEAAFAREKAALATAEARLETGLAELEQIQAQQPRAELERLLTVSSGLGEMQRATDGYVLAQAQQCAAIKALKATADAVVQSRAQAEDCQARVAQAEATVRALTLPVERAELAVGDIAQTLRARLESGQPCMVCGAIDHPIHGDEALAKLARQLRADLEAERQTLVVVRAAHNAALRDIDSHEHGLLRSENERDAAAQGMRSFAVQFDAARGAVTDLGLEVPEIIGADVAALIADAKARRGVVEGLIRDERRVEDAITLDRKLVKTCVIGIETSRSAIEEKRRMTALAHAEVELKQQACDNGAQRLQAIVTTLSPILNGAKLPISEVESDPQAARARFAALVEGWQAQVQARDAATSRLIEIAPQLSAAKADLRAAETACNTAGQVLKGRGSALAEVVKARAALLGGEDTETHRSRHNQSRLDAQAEKDRLGAVANNAAAQLLVVETDHARIVAALAPAREKAEAARQDLNAKLAVQGLTHDRLGQLLALGAPEIDRLSDVLKALDDALTSAISALTSRKADLAEVAAKGLPEESAEDLLALQTSLEVARTTKQERSGAITQMLLADDAVQAGLSALDAEIRAAKTLANTWAAVNEAVGSKQGGKFSQIAQAVTLSLLVERANLHLGDLAPRYRLAAGGDDLSLHMVDHDMGDEVRSSRSLSGGERFLVSLSLALALSSMGSHGGLAATLFIDEGFGALDSRSLDVAVDALEALQAQGRTIGVISHVEAMKDRIPVQIRVSRKGGGASTLVLSTLP